MGGVGNILCVVHVRGHCNAVRVTRRCFHCLMNGTISSYCNITNVIHDNAHRNLHSLIAHHTFTSSNMQMHDGKSGLIMSVRVRIVCNVGVTTVSGDVIRGIHCYVRRTANLAIGGIGIFISKVGPRWGCALAHLNLWRK